MAKFNEPYREIVFQSYELRHTSGKRGKIHFKTIAHSMQDPSAEIGLDVECSRSLRQFPVGTIFKIRAKLTDKEGGGDFYYAHHTWQADVVSKPV
ncbi:hypothetical protein JQC79_19190 [Ochrobactrum anthropi]|uniref:hypothetical protein n=1 Tax=Brucella anthropi TaxID=529 RepID=UPI001951E394|nr:hypothetical protein [Brucella anthropi]MBM6397880.1 hypothetical protein [Brucella anthropi]